MTPLRLLLVLLFLSFPCLPANPDKAAKVQADWEQAVRQWQTLSEQAVTPEQRAKLIETRPDAVACCSQMWAILSPSLDQPWTIGPAAWFLQLSHAIRKPDQPDPLFAAQIEQIKQAVFAHHVKRSHPDLKLLCLALASLGDPQSLSLLETIEKENPDPGLQGVAALAASMIIRNLGDDAELMRKRLTYLRKAIINSADIELGGTTVAKLAESQLYQIRFLSKGRIAPDLTGVDSEGQPFQLSEQVGKVIVLIFWSSTIDSAEHVIEFTNEMHAKLRDQPVEVIGINHDPLDKLRGMRSDGSVTWRNITDPDNRLARDYRVGIWPMVYVLDQHRRIHYAGALGSFAELTADALAAELK